MNQHVLLLSTSQSGTHPVQAFLTRCFLEPSGLHHKRFLVPCVTDFGSRNRLLLLRQICKWSKPAEFQYLDLLARHPLRSIGHRQAVVDQTGSESTWEVKMVVCCTLPSKSSSPTHWSPFLLWGVSRAVLKGRAVSAGEKKSTHHDANIFKPFVDANMLRCFHITPTVFTEWNWVPRKKNCPLPTGYSLGNE